MDSSTYVVTVDGELDVARAAELHAALNAVPAEARRVVLDLSAVTFLESMLLGALLLAKFRWDQEGRKVATIVTDPQVLRFMTILNVLERLSVRGSLEDALKAMEEHPAHNAV